MQEAIPVLIVLGGSIAALILVLVGIFLSTRSRNAEQPKADAPPGAEAPAGPPGTSTEPPSESIRLHLEPDGRVIVEMEGRRFTRLDGIMDERLKQRAQAAINGMQRFRAPSAAPGPALAEWSDELRAGHAPPDGALVIEFRKQRYRRLTDIQDGEIGRRLLAMISELVAFAQGIVLPVGPPAPASEPKAPSEEEFLKQLATPPAAPEPLKMPTIVDALRHPAPKPAPMPVGIAGQIDAILQEQLIGNAALEGRPVRLSTASDGSLIVQAGSQSLRWPDQVTDPDVREAVQRAVRTWEQR